MATKKVSKSGLNKELIKTEENSRLKFFFINGNYVRKHYYKDFIHGGHHFVGKHYHFIPKNEIWIEHDLKDRVVDREGVIAHEDFERGIMLKNQLSYDKAHELALLEEQRVRDEIMKARDRKINKLPQEDRREDFGQIELIIRALKNIIKRGEYKTEKEAENLKYRLDKLIQFKKFHKKWFEEYDGKLEKTEETEEKFDGGGSITVNETEYTFDVNYDENYPDETPKVLKSINLFHGQKEIGGISFKGLIANGKKYLHVIDIEIVENYRNKGLSTELYKKALQVIKADGIYSGIHSNTLNNIILKHSVLPKFNANFIDKTTYVIDIENNETFAKGGSVTTGTAGSDTEITVKPGAIVITKSAVQSKKKYDFEGKKLTPVQILSKINQDAGGKSLIGSSTECTTGCNLTDKGKPHSSGGIKTEVHGTGNVVEVESDELILVPAVQSSAKKYTFEGKKMTGKKIASYLNEAYGGVPIHAKGGEVMAKGGGIEAEAKKEAAEHPATFAKIQAGEIHTPEDLGRSIAEEHEGKQPKKIKLTDCKYVKNAGEGLFTSGANVFEGIIAEDLILYRGTNEYEITDIKNTGKIIGSDFAVPVERKYGASFAYKIEDAKQAATAYRSPYHANKYGLDRIRFDELDKYVIAINAKGKKFARFYSNAGEHDENYIDCQNKVINPELATIGLGFSVSDVTIDDVVDLFVIDKETGGLKKTHFFMKATEPEYSFSIGQIVNIEPISDTGEITRRWTSGNENYYSVRIKTSGEQTDYPESELSEKEIEEVSVPVDKRKTLELRVKFLKREKKPSKTILMRIKFIEKGLAKKMDNGGCVLEEIRGTKPTKTGELILYYNKNKEFEDIYFTSPDEAYRFILDHFPMNEIETREIFGVLFLDRKNKIISYKTDLFNGGISTTIVDVPLIMSMAYKALASGIIVFHNHPSLDLRPSEQDISITKKLKEAAAVVGISVLDHIIITKEKHYSFANNGIMELGGEVGVGYPDLSKSNTGEYVLREYATGGDIHGATVTHNTRQNGVEIRFTSNPGDEIINQIKSKGFRWARFNKVWYKHYTESLFEWAKDFINNYPKQQAAKDTGITQAVQTRPVVPPVNDEPLTNEQILQYDPSLKPLFEFVSKGIYDFVKESPAKVTIHNTTYTYDSKKKQYWHLPSGRKRPDWYSFPQLYNMACRFVLKHKLVIPIKLLFQNKAYHSLYFENLRSIIKDYPHLVNAPDYQELHDKLEAAMNEQKRLFAIWNAWKEKHLKFGQEAFGKRDGKVHVVKLGEFGKITKEYYHLYNPAGIDTTERTSSWSMNISTFLPAQLYLENPNENPDAKNLIELYGEPEGLTTEPKETVVETKVEPVAEEPKAEQPKEVFPPDEWRGHLIKSRSYARDLMTDKELEQARSEGMDWTDQKSIERAIDKHLGIESKTEEKSETKDDSGIKYPHPLVGDFVKIYRNSTDNWDGKKNLSFALSMGMSGDRHKDKRQELMSALTGQPVPKAQSGITNIEKAIMAFIEKNNLLLPEAQKEVSKPVAKKYAVLEMDYFGAAKGSIGEVIKRPNMFVTELYFGKNKSGQRLEKTIDNKVIRYITEVPELAKDGLSEKFVLTMGRSAFMDNLHPLDMWKQFDGDGRWYREFHFSKDQLSKERMITDLGVKERMMDAANGGLNAIISVPTEAEADRINELYVREFPVEGMIIKPEAEAFGTFAGQVDAQLMADRYKENIPVYITKLKEYQEAWMDLESQDIRQSDFDEIVKELRQKYEDAETGYTNAPESYDGFDTATIDISEFVDDRNGKHLRKVIIPKSALANDWQKNRYYSGGYGLYSEEEAKMIFGKPAPTKLTRNDYISAIDGLTVMLEYAEGDEKQNYLDAIAGLETMIELI